jgi:arylsulfatase A-like enzyme
MPTILGLGRFPMPRTVEGLDYSRYLRGGKDPSDGSCLISCIAPFGQWERRQGGREYRGIRTTRYTYVRDRSGPWLLFDNEADPYQLVNLVNRPDTSAVQANLEARLTRKLRKEADKFLSGKDYIRKWGYHVNENGTVPYSP